jgi:hypothetical protein
MTPARTIPKRAYRAIATRTRPRDGRGRVERTRVRGEKNGDQVPAPARWVKAT